MHSGSALELYDIFQEFAHQMFDEFLRFAEREGMKPAGMKDYIEQEFSLSDEFSEWLNDRQHPNG